MIQELHTEYTLAQTSYSDSSKCLDIVSGSGFKIIGEKAYKKFKQDYPENRYIVDESTLSVQRSIIGENVGKVVISAMVKQVDRIDNTFIVEVKAEDLDHDDRFFAELYHFGDVDVEEFLKGLAIAKAMNQYKVYKAENEALQPALKRVKVKFASAHRYTIEITFSELPS